MDHLRCWWPLLETDYIDVIHITVVLPRASFLFIHYNCIYFRVWLKVKFLPIIWSDLKFAFDEMKRTLIVSNCDLTSFKIFKNLFTEISYHRWILYWVIKINCVHTWTVWTENFYIINSSSSKRILYPTFSSLVGYSVYSFCNLRILISLIVLMLEWKNE